MSKFRVGDKVRFTGSSSILEEGKVYKVSEVYDEYGVEWMRLAGVDAEDWDSQSGFFELVEDRSKYHKHHDVICAWARGEDVEVRWNINGRWVPLANCSESHSIRWACSSDYRIKPAPTANPDIERIETEMRKLADQLAEIKKEGD